MQMYDYNTELSTASMEILQKLAASQFISHEQLKLADTLSFGGHALLRRNTANDFFLSNAGAVSVALPKDVFFIDSVFDEYKIKLKKYTILPDSGDIILFIHGGGWVSGNVDTHDTLCMKIAEVFQKNVISVDYRLSPECKFPIPLNDVTSAFLWCVKNGYENVILAGDSVSGNLCAALCVNLAKMQHSQPKAQILFYPILSCDLDSKAYQLFACGYGLTKEWTKNYIYQYTGAEYDDKAFLQNELVYPLYANASVFPKTFIASASCDILLDDAFRFAEKIRNNGGFVYHIIEPSSVHGFMTYGRYFAKEVDHILGVLKTEFDKNC